MFDCEMRYLAVSNRWCLDQHLDPGEIIGRSHDELFPDTPKRWREIYRRALAGEVLREESDCLQRPDGTIQWHHWEIHPWLNADGAPGGVVLFSEDITERKEAEQALAESRIELETANDNLYLEVAKRTMELTQARDYFHKFVMKAPFAMCVIDSEGRMTLRNEQFLRLFGHGENYSPTMIEWWREVCPDPTTQDRICGIWSYLSGEASKSHHAMESFEFTATCASGQTRDIEIGGVAVDKAFLATFFDVTERNCAQAELRQRRDAAEFANQAKSDFLANMSHEIRTPMNAVLGAAQLLELNGLDESQYRYVTMIRTAGQSLLEIINNILDLSKIEAGHLDIDLSPFVLVKVLEDVVDVLTPAAIGKGLRLRVEPLPEPLPALIGDASRLRQILFNLVGNALKFTPQGEVCISVAVEEASPERFTLRFIVRDTGI